MSTVALIFTSAKEDMFFVVVCLCVCLLVFLFVSKFAQKQTSERICVKFSVTVGNGPMNIRLKFGGDPEQRSPDKDPDPYPYCDTGKMCLGEMMHCPSASTFF